MCQFLAICESLLKTVFQLFLLMHCFIFTQYFDVISEIKKNLNSKYQLSVMVAEESGL